jgi:galacturan 1,4-alpha-galacturonidase
MPTKYRQGYITTKVTNVYSIILQFYQLYTIRLSYEPFNMLSVAAALSLLSMAPAISASPVQRCTGSISSLDDIADAVKCTTVSSKYCSITCTLTEYTNVQINIESFTVPAGETFSISAPDGATINVKGKVTVRPIKLCLVLRRLNMAHIVWSQSVVRASFRAVGQGHYL